MSIKTMSNILMIASNKMCHLRILINLYNSAKDGSGLRRIIRKPTLQKFSSSSMNIMPFIFPPGESVTIMPCFFIARINRCVLRIHSVCEYRQYLEISGLEIHLLGSVRLGNLVLGNVRFVKYLLQCCTQKAYVLPDILKPMLNLFYCYEVLWWLTP